MATINRRRIFHISAVAFRASLFYATLPLFRTLHLRLFCALVAAADPVSRHRGVFPRGSRTSIVFRHARTAAPRAHGIRRFRAQQHSPLLRFACGYRLTRTYHRLAHQQSLRARISFASSRRRAFGVSQRIVHLTTYLFTYIPHLPPLCLDISCYLCSVPACPVPIACSMPTFALCICGGPWEPCCSPCVGRVSANSAVMRARRGVWTSVIDGGSRHALAWRIGIPASLSRLRNAGASAAPAALLRVAPRRAQNARWRNRAATMFISAPQT